MMQVRDIANIRYMDVIMGTALAAAIIIYI